MDYSCRVRCCQAAGNLRRDIELPAQSEFCTAQRLAIQQLAHHAAVADVVNRDDVGMIQCCDSSRLRFEARPPRSISWSAPMYSALIGVVDSGPCWTSARSRPYKLDGLESTFSGIGFRERGRDPLPSLFSAPRPLQELGS